MHAPIIAAQMTVISAAPATRGMWKNTAHSRTPTIHDSSRNVLATIIRHPVARPSIPSVRFTALELPVITRIARITYRILLSAIGSVRNGR